MSQPEETNNNPKAHEITARGNFARVVAEASPDILFVMDLNTRDLIYTNRAIEEILGYSREQLLQMKQPFFEIMHPEDVPMFDNHLKAMKLSKDGEIVEVEYRMRHVDGSIRWFSDRNTVFKRDEKGIPTEKLGISHDSTSEKEAEEKIYGLNRSLISKNRELESVYSELSTFNTIAANDYQETLRSLYTNLEYIISHDAKNLSDAAKANVRKAQMAIQKMKLLTDDIVAYSRIPNLDSNSSQVDLNKIFAAVLADMQTKIAEAKVVINIENLPELQGFPLLLSLLFHHLIDNAIKFRKDDPTVTISYEVANSLPFETATRIKYHQVTVADDGIGFNQEQAESIFTIFKQLNEKQRYRGSGIGLAVCKKIMDLHGGRIFANSVPGKGASFSCFFPIEG